MATWTRWEYIFSYRAQWGATGYGEMTGSAYSPKRPLTEIELQQLCLNELSGCPDILDDLRPEDIVLTRFNYTELPPVLVPDTVVQADGTVSLSEPDTASRTDTPGDTGQV